MNKSRHHPFRPSFLRGGMYLALLLFVSAISCLPAAQETKPSPPIFLAPESRVWLNETQVIPVKVAVAPDEKRILKTIIVPPEAAEIIQPATVLKGETTGFLRLRGLRPGKAELQVEGKTQAIRITANTLARPLAPKPEVVSPPSGACLYGTITVGVEINLPAPGTVISEPGLLLSGGRELVPRAQTLSAPGSARLYAFDLNADELPAGPLSLQAFASDAAGLRIAGEPVAVNVIRPDPSTMVSGLCAERINDPRPVRFGEKIPGVSSKDPAVPGYVMNPSTDPAWCMKETIEKPGLYQLTMRVRGDAAMGSFPSVGVVINEGDYALAASRLVDHDWHRIPIGHPVRLEAGEQILTARFLNDFSQGKNNDRNLYLDRYELVRVTADAPAAAEAGDASMMMSGGDSMIMMAGDPMAPARGAPLRVSFNERLDGRIVQGPLTLRATCWRPPKSPAPTVELIVNGESVTSQQGSELNFRLPVSDLQEGPNTIQLRARSEAGPAASCPAETVILPPGIPGSPARRSFRFTVEDQAWDSGMAQRLDKEKPVAAFYTNGEAILTLPEGLTGDFAVQMEARGEEFNGPPVVEAFLKAGENPAQKIGEVSVKNDRTWTFGKTHLEAGAKQLILRFSNDAAVEKQGDRNWWLRAASLEEDSPRAEQPLRLTVLYPKKNPFAVNEAGAVVAEVFSSEGVEWTDLVIDGQPQNLRISSETSLGRVVLPFVAASLKPGDHSLLVHTRSRNGKETDSAPITLRIGWEKPDRNYASAVHLLNRFGYGPEPEELADILTLGEKAWLHDRLSRPWTDPGEQAAFQRAANEFSETANKGQVVPRALAHLLRSPNPVRNRFVLWAENHFSTWIEKADPLNKWAEHKRFLELGAAPFGSLLKASATSPAMLVYLDQNRSFANKLNENYAREIMELHTVGVHAGYRQEDVTALASILTGWTLSSDAPTKGEVREMTRTFRFDPLLNAPAGHHVFGMEFPKADDPQARYDRTLAAIEMLAAHPATAEFISRKLAEHYVSLPAPDSLVKRLAAQFLQNGGDMAALLETIAGSKEFRASMDTPKIATPLDFSLRIGRLTGSGNAGVVRDFLHRSGTGLFDRATPDGFPEADAAYADSNALLQRWRFITLLSGSLRKLLPAAPVAWQEAGQGQALDGVSLRLIGRPLPAPSRQAALQYLSKITPAESERSKVVASLVAELPPVSLR
ncbi:MAG: DUF1800 family protein [Terrimicrobiaceae bacterium]